MLLFRNANKLNRTHESRKKVSEARSAEMEMKETAREAREQTFI